MLRLITPGRVCHLSAHIGCHWLEPYLRSSHLLADHFQFPLNLELLAVPLGVCLLLRDYALLHLILELVQHIFSILSYGINALC